MHPVKARRRDSGLTLLELVVAITVLSIGSLAALRSADQSRVAIGGAQDRMLAQLVATNRAEELKIRGLQERLPDQVEIAGRQVTIQTTRKATQAGLTQATITARVAGSAGAQFVIYLPRTLR